ncbi:MAG: DUF1926 domain-containing protein [Dehalococcoidia bacterium]|nr:DUF1926 domain-containing protein [Dehalococcoidia bacterium]
MKLSLVLHAHQPPGNYDSVFQRAIDTCYGPVLDLIEARPTLRVSLHCSGSLLEWVVEHAPDRIDQIRRMVEARQVELVAAGMYEPVLSLLPRHDRAPQIRTHRAYLQRLFGADAHVGWLTERVWEPSLAADLVDGGLDTVVLDDRHLLSAGLLSSQLDAPFLTESQGKPLRVAAAVEDLRMAIPWKPVEQVADLLRRKARAGVRLAVYADDIEKFGMWPGTYRDVIRRGWLARFFDALTALGDDVEVVPLGEAAEAVPSAGRVYIPDGTYPEMLEWSLPPAGQRAFREARETLERRGLLGRTSPFLRVGTYLQFLAKYPEVNHLHKRVLDVSTRAATRGRRAPSSWDPQQVPPAQLDLWRAQANCAYWHGLFGGAYLPHIRQRLWYHLLRAERALEVAGERRRVLRVLDLDADGTDEALITTEDLVVAVAPSEGAVVEISDRRAAVNLVDTLARRDEGYHGTGDDAPYPYDRGRRGCFVDRFLPPGRAPGRRTPIEDAGDFEGRPYAMDARRRRGAVDVVLTREGDAPGGRGRVEKTVSVAEAGREIEARYRVSAAEGALDARFAVELNFGLLFAEHPAGELVVAGRTFGLPRGGAGRSVDECVLRMTEPPVTLRIECTRPADLDVRPVETLSRSEGGYERTAQQLAVLLSWPLRLTGDESFATTVRLSVDGAEAEA